MLWKLSRGLGLIPGWWGALGYILEVTNLLSLDLKCTILNYQNLFQLSCWNEGQYHCTSGIVFRGSKMIVAITTPRGQQWHWVHAAHSGPPCTSRADLRQVWCIGRNEIRDSQALLCVCVCVWTLYMCSIWPRYLQAFTSGCSSYYHETEWKNSGQFYYTRTCTSTRSDGPFILVINRG